MDDDEILKIPISIVRLFQIFINIAIDMAILISRTMPR